MKPLDALVLCLLVSPFAVLDAARVAHAEAEARKMDGLRDRELRERRRLRRARGDLQRLASELAARATSGSTHPTHWEHALRRAQETLRTLAPHERRRLEAWIHEDLAGRLDVPTHEVIAHVRGEPRPRELAEALLTARLLDGALHRSEALR